MGRGKGSEEAGGSASFPSLSSRRRRRRRRRAVAAPAGAEGLGAATLPPLGAPSVPHARAPADMAASAALAAPPAAAAPQRQEEEASVATAAAPPPPPFPPASALAPLAAAATPPGGLPILAANTLADMKGVRSRNAGNSSGVSSFRPERWCA